MTGEFAGHVFARGYGQDKTSLSHTCRELAIAESQKIALGPRGEVILDICRVKCLLRALCFIGNVDSEVASC